MQMNTMSIITGIAYTKSLECDCVKQNFPDYIIGLAGIIIIIIGAFQISIPMITLGFVMTVYFEVCKIGTMVKEMYEKSKSKS